MRLKSFTDYGLRVLMHVATAPGGRTTIGEIACAYGISGHHLVKVVHQLGRTGFLANSRGRGGGLKLSRPAARIRVGDVVRAMEGDDPLVECFQSGGNGCTIGGVCKLRSVLARAMRAFCAELDGHTLQDLVAGPASGRMIQILHPELRAGH